MGALQQLGLILWKNLIQRKRHPGILFLEVIWPVVIFVVVALVRLAAPPEPVDQCHYAPRAMPSAGGFPFLQSFTCNLENQCFPDEESARKTKDNPRITEFVSSAAPFTADLERANNLLKDLPKATKILNSLQNTLDSPEIREIIDTKLTLGEFLTDKAAVRRKLVQEMGVLPGTVVDALLNSSINVTQLYKLTGYTDFKAIVCDPEELKSYILIRGEATAEQISKQLCDLDDDLIPDITKVIQQQIDMAAIIKLVSELKKAMGEYSDAQMLMDIMDMLEVLQNSSLASIFLDQNSVLNLQQTAHWILDLVKFVQDMLQDGGALNINMLQSLMVDLDPIITSLTGNASWWFDYKKNVAQVYVILDMVTKTTSRINDMEVTLSSMFGEDHQLLSWLQKDMNLTMDNIQRLLSVPLNMAKMAEFLAVAVEPGMALKDTLCVRPGLISVFNLTGTDTETKQHLTNISQTLCRLDLTNITRDFNDIFDMSKLMVKPGDVDHILRTYNFSEVYELGKNMYSKLNDMLTWLGPLLSMESLSTQQIWDTLAQTATSFTQLSSASSGDIEKLLGSYSWMFEMIIDDPTTRLITVSYSYILDMLSPATLKIQSLKSNFVELLKESEASRRFLSELVQSDAILSGSVRYVLVQSYTIQVLKNDPERYLERIACNETYLDQILNVLPSDKYNVTIVRQLLCRPDLVPVLQEMTQHLDMSDIDDTIQKLYGIWSGAINISSSAYDDRADTSMLNQRTMDYWRLLETTDIWVVTEDDWKDVQDLNPEFRNVDWDDFNSFISSLTLQLQVSMGRDAYVTLGPALEASSLWPMMYSLMRISVDCVQFSNQMSQFSTDMMTQNTASGRIATAVQHAVPDVLDVVTQVMINATFGQHMLTFGNGFCNQTLDPSLPALLHRPALSTLRKSICADGEDMIQEMNDLTELGKMCFDATEDKIKPIDWEAHYWLVYNMYVVLPTTPTADWSSAISVLNMTAANQAINNMIQAISSQNTTLAVMLDNIGSTVSEFGNSDIIQSLMAGEHPVNNLLRYLANAVSDFCRTYADMMEDLFENGISLDDMTHSYPELRDFVEKQVDFMPDLMNALQTGIMQPNKMIQMMMSADLSQKTWCEDFHLTDIMTFEDEVKVAEFEAALCDLDMKRVLQSLMSMPQTQAYSIAVDRLFNLNHTVATEYNGTVDWKELYHNCMRLVNMWTQATQMDTSRILPGIVSRFNFTAINSTLQGMMQGFNTSSLSQLYEGLSGMDSLLKSLTSGDPTSVMMYSAARANWIISTAYMNMSNHMMARLIGANITISEMIPSAELQTVLLGNSFSPEMLQVMLNGLTSLITNPTTVSSLAGDITKICSDSTVFSKYFPITPGSGVDPSALQQTLCGATSVDWDLVQQQLVQNTPGAAEYMHVVILYSQNYPHGLDDYPFDIGAYLEAQMASQSLIQQLILNPPNIMWQDLLMQASPAQWQAIIDQFLEKMSQISKQNDYSGLYKGLDMLMPLVKNLTSEDLYAGIDTGMIVANEYTKMLTHNLAEFVGANLSLSFFLRSEELLRFIQPEHYTPQQLEMILNGVVTILTNPEKLNDLVYDQPKFCNDSSVLLKYFPVPPGSGLNASYIQQLFCESDLLSMYVNWELVQQQQLENAGLSEYLRLVELASVPGGLQNYTFNISDYVQTMMTYQVLISEIIQNPPTFHYNDIIIETNSADWQAVFERFMEKISQMSKQYNYGNLNQIMPQLEQLASLYPNNTIISEIDSIMNTVAGVMESLVILQDASKIFTGYPRLEKLMIWQQHLPEIFATIVLSSADQAKFGELNMILATNVSMVCHLADIEVYLTPLPNTTIQLDFNDMKTTFCDVEGLTAELMAFANKYQNTGKEMNLTATFYRMMAAQQKLTELLTANITLQMELFPWLDTSTWDAVFQHVLPVLTSQAEDYSWIIDLTKQLSGLPMNFPPEVNAQLNGQLAVYQTLTKLIDQTSNRTLQLTEMFPDATEITKLLELVEQDLPQIVSILIASSDTPQFQQLYEYNLTTALIEICHPLHNIEDYLTIPPQFDIDLDLYKNQFCQVNFTALESEIFGSDFLNIGNIMQQYQNTAAVNVTAYVQVYMEYFQSQTRYQMSPVILSPDAPWLNITQWAQVFASSSDMSNLPAQILKGMNGMQQILSMLVEDGETTIDMANAVIADLVKSMGHFLARLPSNNITLADLMGNNTLLLDYILLSYEAPIELVEGMLHAAIHKPDVLLKFLIDTSLSGNPIEFYCNHTMKELTDMFQFPDHIDLQSAYQLECKVNTTQLSDEAMKLFGIDEIIAKLQTAISTGDFTSLKLNETEFLKDYQTLMIEMGRIMQDGNNFGAIEMNYDMVISLFNELMKKYSTLDDTKAMLQLYSALMKALPMGSESFDQYFHVSQIILDYTTGILRQLDVQNRTLSLVSLFSNSTQLSAILGQGFDLSLLSQVTIRLDKIGGLVGVLEQDLTFICDASRLQEYFVFPAGTDVTGLSNALCKLNTTILAQELMEIFSFQNLAAQLTEAYSKPNTIDVDEYYKSYEEFLSEIMKVVNVTDADILGLTWSHLSSNLNVSWMHALEKLTGASQINPMDMSMYAGNLEEMDRAMHNIASWTYVRATLVGAQMYMDLITDKVSQWPLVNLTIKDVLVDAPYTSEYIQRTFAITPEVAYALMNAKVDWGQLLSGMPTDPDYACSDAITYPADVDMADVRTALCDVNFTALALELQDDWNWVMIRDKFQEVAVDMNYRMNWTSYIQSVSKLQDVVLYFTNLTFPDSNTFFKYDGSFDTWFNRVFKQTDMGNLDSPLEILEYSLQTFMTSINALSEVYQLDTVVIQLLHTASETASTLNNWLKTLSPDGFRLSDIVDNTTQTGLMLQSTLNLQPELIQALLHANLSQDLFLMVIENSRHLPDVLCNRTALSEHLQLDHNATVTLFDLQTALCNVNITVMVYELQQMWNVDGLVKQFSRLLSEAQLGGNQGNMTGPVDTQKLVTEWQQLLTLLGSMTQPRTPPGGGLGYNMSTLPSILDSLMNPKMSMILVQGVKIGLVSAMSVVPQDISGQVVSVLRMINDQLKVVTDSGLYINELTNDTALSIIMSRLVQAYNMENAENITSESLGVEIDRLLTLYQILTDRDYFRADPETLILLLQKVQIHMTGIIIEQLNMTGGQGSMWGEFEQNLQMTTGIMEYINSMLDTAKDGDSIRLEKLLPDVDAVRRLLTSTMDADTSELFLLMGIKPELLTASMDQAGFVQKVCDEFRKMFDVSVMSLYNVTQLQQNMCTAARNDSLIIQQIIDLMDISTFYKLIMPDPAKQGGVWADYMVQIGRMVDNINYLTNVPIDTSSTMQWFKSLSQLPSQFEVDLNSTLRYLDSCDMGVSWLEAQYPGQIQSSLLMAQFYMKSSLLSVQAMEELESLVCLLPTLNLTDLFTQYKNSKLAEMIQMYVDVYSGMYHNATFSCGEYVNLATEYTKAYGRMMENSATQWSRAIQCLTDTSNSNIPALTQIDGILGIVRKAYGLIQNSPDLLSILPPELTPQLDQILKIFLKQEPTLMKLEKIWVNGSNIVDTLSDLMGLSPDMIKMIMDSTIDLNLLPLVNLTETALADLVCSPQALEDMLNILPGLPINATTISNALCGSNLTETLEMFKSSANIGNILIELYKSVPEYSLSTEWFSRFTANIDELITNLQSAFELRDLMQDFDQLDLIALLGKLQKFLDENSPEAIFENIYAILNDLKTVVPPSGQNFLDDLRNIAAGVQSLRILNRLPFDAPLSSLMKEPDILRMYMIQSLGLSEQVTDSILNSSLLYAKLAKVGDIDLKDVVCTPEDLATLLTFNPDVNVSAVSEHLCGLSQDQVVQIFDYITQNIEIGDFIKDFINIRPELVLEKANITKEEIKQIADNFKPFKGKFKGLTQGFTNLTHDIELSAMSEALTGKDSGAATLSVFGEVICGRDETFDVDDSYRLTDENRDNTNIYSGKRRKRDTEAEKTRKLSRFDRKQMEELRTEFCQDLYLAIKDAENGYIIWAYLKPLIRGKILYSPVNEVTKAIMEEATKMLSDVNGLKDLLKTLSVSLKSVSQENVTDYSILQKTLGNPFVSGAITETLGFDASDLVGDLDSLTELTGEDSEKIITIAELAHNMIECLEEHRLNAFSSEAKLEEEARYLMNSNNILAGVVFLDMEESEAGRSKRQVSSPITLPKHVRYKIRMDIENVPTTEKIVDNLWRPMPEDNFAMHLRYLRGFIELQDMIDGAIIKFQNGDNETKPVTQIQQFPYPCYDKDDFKTYISTYFLPIMMFLAWLVAVAVAIHTSVYDRENKLEETMKIMGLRGGVNWSGWFFNSLIFMLLMCIIIVLVLKFGQLLPKSDPILVWLFLADFSLSMIMFSYMVSAFFTRTTLASLTGVILYLISYLPFVILVALETDLLFYQTSLLCLSATTSFSFGCQLMTRRELEGVGQHWDNARVIDWDYTFDWCCYMMLIDSAVYAIVGWYVRNVFPGRYGVAQPWYFCVSPTYWCSCCRKSSASSKYQVKDHKGENGDKQVVLIQSITKCTNGATPSDTFINQPMYRSTLSSTATISGVLGEPDPVNLPVGVSIHQLRKTFKKHVAVKDLNVNLYRGQVTALLGENGAGKTTTINLLTGYLRPTSGRAFIEGRDITKDMSHIRKDLGICPQQDVLFDFMTVFEHLDLFVNLKGKGKRKDKKDEMHRMLGMAGLESCRHTRVSQLSGGQRRRLSVVLAFIGGSRVIILDEPTSGVDPCARRAIWDLIIQNREGRTILLCTHHLDEADILADRVLIMHQGRLMCSGSPMYLKTHYGSGYHLTLSKQQAQDVISKDSYADRSAASATKILQFIQQHNADAYISEEVGMEITIILPTDRGQAAKFHQLFVHLDSNLDTLNVSSYGVSDTSLEEVFLKLTHQANQDKPIEEKSLKTLSWTGSDGRGLNRDSGMSDGTPSTSKSSPRSDSSGLQSDKVLVPEEPSMAGSLTTTKRVTGSSLSSYRFGALFMKRLHHHRRDVKSYLSQIILPVAFICVAMACTLVSPKPTDHKSLLLTPDMYGPETFMFFRMDEYSTENAEYIDTLLKDPGLGTSCMADSYPDGNCSATLDPTFHTPPVDDPSIYNDPEPCVCSGGFSVCPDGASGPPLPQMTTRSENYIQNLTGSPLRTEDYLVKSHQEFLRNRYGGWSFGVDEVKSPEATIWWDNKGWHALPSYYSALSNMVLRAGVQGDQSQYGISTYNHPLPLSKKQLSEQLLMQGIAETGIALTILCAFCFVPAGYAIYLVRERMTQEKRLQFVYGVGLGLYWFTALIWDMLAYLFTVALAVAIAACFQIDIYTARLNLAAFTVSLLMFGWASIPLVYLMSRRFRSSATGYMMTFIINLLIGVTTTVTIFLLKLFSYKNLIKKAHTVLSNLFLIFPQFCLGDALIRLSRNQFMTKINERFHVDTYVSPFTFEMLLWHFVALAIEGLVFLILHLVIEARPCQKSKGVELAVAAVQSGLDSVNRKKMDPSYKEDEDVSLERQRVMTGEARNDLLVLYNLKKKFKKGRQNITAVDNLTLGIPRGECFGLLGVNGAGKSTTFDMVTGEITPTAGAALLDGHVISENTPNMRQMVGYCPQENALDLNLSVTEMLVCYGKLKGLHSNGLKQVVDNVIKKMGLTEHRKKTVKALSGGSRRKLSTAIALLGEPDIVLMDEPTSGMDPQTKRLVWDMVINVIKDNRSVLFTSHSMAECEAICTRLSIMVNGRFMCLGSRQQIQHRFGQGYTVTIKAASHVKDLSTIVDYMLSTFQQATFKDHHLNMLEFEIPHATTRLSDIFGALEMSKSRLGLQDYSVSQTSLDQVFIQFARHQHDGTGEAPPSLASSTLGVEPGYTNPSYDTWEQRPAVAANIPPELHLATDTTSSHIQPGDRPYSLAGPTDGPYDGPTDGPYTVSGPTDGGLYPQVSTTQPRATPLSTEPGLQSVIIVDDPTKGGLYPEAVIHL